jgi:hypothetical protein
MSCSIQLQSVNQGHSPFVGPFGLRVEAGMPKMTDEKLKSDWIATKNIVRFQDMLKTETEEGKCKILSQLLEKEFRQFK